MYSAVASNINPIPTDIKQPIVVSKISADAKNGNVLFEEGADIIRPPASLVKLMLMYLVALKINKKEIKLEDSIKIKRPLYPANHSDILLSHVKNYTLAYLMDAVAVISSNTSAIAITECLWGSKEKCIEEMNLMAKKLKMNSTCYATVSGYPQKSGEDLDRTTARDLMQLAMECCKMPIIISWTSKKKFVFQDEKIERDNTNKLMNVYLGCDGLKTGYTKAAGYCIVATAKRSNTRVVSIVLGAEKSSMRFKIATNLLEIAFSEIS
ncbi:MAG TPA: serine hydrolase [Candidatus Hydrogenedens sp.]|nr:serine hydrolase [Candidatus Hydrogenedens sp.]